MKEGRPRRSPVQGWKRMLGLLGILAHLVIGYFYLTSGLVVPAIWLTGFLLVWVGLLALGIWLVVRRPLWALLVPVLTLAVLVGGVTLGGAVLGWSA